MKILVIGDPHGYNKYKKSIFKGVDLILVTGDLGKADKARKFYFDNLKRKEKGLLEVEKNKNYFKEVHMEIHKSTIEILKNLSRYAPVYTIQGNMGISTMSQVKEDRKKYGVKIPCTRKMVDGMKNVNLVKNRLRIIGDLRVGFLEYFIDTNWVIDFKPEDYKNKLSKAKKETNKAKKILKRFGKIDILVCHQPPHKVLDKVSSKYDPPKKWIGLNAGSKVVLNYVKKHQPKYVLCGHIHEGKGKRKVGKTTVINAGCCGDYYVLEV